MSRVHSRKILKAVVHVTEDILLDLDGIYASDGEAADEVRDALVGAIRSMMRNQWDESRIKPYGILGTTFTFDFCSGYVFTFSINTYFNEEVAVEEHYFIKNLFSKK